MRPIKNASAGSSESDDVLVMITPADELEIVVESAVFELYGDSIYSTIKDTIDTLGLEKAHVVVNDRGAVDFVLEARVETAVRRSVREGF